MMTTEWLTVYYFQEERLSSRISPLTLQKMKASFYRFRDKQVIVLVDSQYNVTDNLVTLKTFNCLY